MKMNTKFEEKYRKNKPKNMRKCFVLSQNHAAKYAKRECDMQSRKGSLHIDIDNICTNIK